MSEMNFLRQRAEDYKLMFETWKAIAEKTQQERDELKEALFYEKRATEEWHEKAVSYMQERDILLQAIKDINADAYDSNGIYNLSKAIIAKIEGSN